MTFGERLAEIRERTRKNASRCSGDFGHNTQALLEFESEALQIAADDIAFLLEAVGVARNVLEFYAKHASVIKEAYHTGLTESQVQLEYCWESSCKHDGEVREGIGRSWCLLCSSWIYPTDIIKMEEIRQALSGSEWK